MKTIITLIAALSISASAYAEKFHYKFSGTPVSEAILQITKDHPEINISFIYRELDNYTTSARVYADDAYDALKQVIGLNPITIVEKGSAYYIEALQHGKFRYTGKALGPDKEPVVAATVMLLSPKDSTVITYGITDNAGRFTIPCDSRRVIAKATCLGYTPTYKLCNDFNVGTITMAQLPIRLKTVNVEADLATAEYDKTVYLPTQRQKRIAQNTIDLLRIIGITQISVNPAVNSVTTKSGEDVAIFFDYLEASSGELEGLNTEDVKKIEYIDYPIDPRFKNKKHVINVLLHKLEFGGYTKASADERFLNGFRNNASIYSKFTYKRMTYDLYAGSYNTINHHSGTTYESKYNLADDSGKYSWIDRNETLERSKMQNNKYPATFRATYATDKVQISNTLLFTYDSKPRDIQEGMVKYSQDASRGNNSYSYSRQESFSHKDIGWHGNYSFSFPKDYSMNVATYLIYGRNKDNTMYSLSVPGDFNSASNAKEDAYQIRMEMTATKRLTSKHSLSLHFLGGSEINRINYQGDSDYDINFKFPYFGGFAIYRFSNGKLGISAQAGGAWECPKIDNKKMNDFYPVLITSASYVPCTKSRIQFSVLCATSTPNASVRGANVVRVNELLYHGGNPSLKSNRFLKISLNYTWLPTNNFNITAFGSFFKRFNTFAPCYSHYENGTAILKSYVNSGEFVHTTVGVDFNLNLFDNNLRLTASPSFDAYKNSGYYNVSHLPFEFNVMATYYVNKFYLLGYYQLGNRYMYDNTKTGIYVRGRDFYQISAGWSNSKVNVRLSAIDFLRNDWVCATNEMSAPVYKDKSDIISNTSHRRISISLTYTFGYGKKVKRANEVGEQSGTNSAILK